MLRRSTRVALHAKLMYACLMETKHSSSLRLTVVAKDLWRALATPSGISMTAVLEMLIREQAERQGITSCPS